MLTMMCSHRTLSPQETVATIAQATTEPHAEQYHESRAPPPSHPTTRPAPPPRASHLRSADTRLSARSGRGAPDPPTPDHPERREHGLAATSVATHRRQGSTPAEPRRRSPNDQRAIAYTSWPWGREHTKEMPRRHRCRTGFARWCIPVAARREDSGEGGFPGG